MYWLFLKPDFAWYFPLKVNFGIHKLISKGRVGFGRVRGNEAKYGIDREVGKKGWVSYFVCFPSCCLGNSSSPVLYWSQSASSSVETGILLDPFGPMVNLTCTTSSFVFTFYFCLWYFPTWASSLTSTGLVFFWVFPFNYCSTWRYHLHLHILGTKVLHFLFQKQTM